MVTSRIQVQQRYQIEGEIGAGAMGTVYLAHDEVIDRRVVLKTVRRERVDEQDEERTLVDEARSAGRINHPNLVTVYDVVNDLHTDRVYLALEYVEGRTLRDVMQDAGKLEPDDAIDIALQMSAGLAHLHEAGLIHRDIKPSNILIDGKGTVKITDFGIARAAGGSQLEEDGSVFGTPPYMAPEQLLGLEVDARCDVFSLGVVLYEMLAGAKPFGGRTAREMARRTLGGELKPISSYSPEVPAEVCGVVERAMEREAPGRFASMGDFAEALAVAAGRPEDDAAGKVTSRLLAARSASRPEPSATELIGGRRGKALMSGLRRWGREPWAARVRTLTLAAVLVLLAGGAGSWWLFERFGGRVEDAQAGLNPELVNLQARLIREGSRLLEAGEVERASATLGALELLGPMTEPAKRLRLRIEAEASERGVEAPADPPVDRPRRTPVEAAAVIREALEGSNEDPLSESVLDQLDETLRLITVPADVTRLAVSVSSERRAGVVTVRSGADELLRAEFKKKRKFGIGPGQVGDVSETVDIPPATEELLVYVYVGSKAAKLHRFQGPFEGGSRTAIHVEIDGEGEAAVALESAPGAISLR